LGINARFVLQERPYDPAEIVDVISMASFIKMILAVVQGNVMNIAIIVMMQLHVFNVQAAESQRMECANVNLREF